MFLIVGFAFATVGSLLLERVPGNSLGWVLGATGLLLTLGNLTYQYADQALFVSESSLPGGEIAAWNPVGQPPAFGLLGVALLLFPDGRLPSRRWRPALLVSALGIAGVVVAYAFRPGPLDHPFESVSNPFGAGSAELTDAFGGLSWLLMALGVVLAAVAMVRRLRRSHGLERQQLKWIALAASVAGVVMLANFASFIAELGGVNGFRIAGVGLAFIVFPLAIGVAILRYRLYDIDVVIRRTLVYAGLTAALAGAYIGSVLMLQLLLSPGSDLAIAASTLAVAALFRPLRSRIQHLVDRRFFRSRYDAAVTLEGFGAHLRDEVDLDALARELRTVVGETVQPTHLSLWLKGSR